MPTPEPIKVRVTWEECERASVAIAAHIKPHRPELIVGISRGGLIPAVIVSQILSVPMQTITCRAYQGTARSRKPVHVEGWTDAFNQSCVWFVDDICDTGDTLRTLVGHTAGCPLFHFASMFMKEHSPNPGFAHRIFKGNPWIVFPWEFA